MINNNRFFLDRRYSDGIPAFSLFLSVPGVGPSTSRSLFRYALLSKWSTWGKTWQNRRNRLTAFFRQKLTTSRALKYQLQLRLVFLEKLGVYRLRRRALGLPAHGQRTHSNAATTRRLLGFRKSLSKLARRKAKDEAEKAKQEKRMRIFQMTARKNYKYSKIRKGGSKRSVFNFKRKPSKPFKVI